MRLSNERQLLVASKETLSSEDLAPATEVIFDGVGAMFGAECRSFVTVAVQDAIECGKALLVTGGDGVCRTHSDFRRAQPHSRDHVWIQYIIARSERPFLRASAVTACYEYYKIQLSRNYCLLWVACCGGPQRSPAAECLILIESNLSALEQMFRTIVDYTVHRPFQPLCFATGSPASRK